MPDQTDKQTELSRELRSTMQSSQRKLWNALRPQQNGGVRFRRETPIGDYFADIYCHAARINIEVDGQSHVAKVDADAIRDRALEALGIKTLRVRASDIQDNVDAIANWIVDECRRRIAEGSGLSPSPLARLRRRGPLPKGEEINATASPVSSPPGRGPRERSSARGEGGN